MVLKKTVVSFNIIMTTSVTRSCFKNKDGQPIYEDGLPVFEDGQPIFVDGLPVFVVRPAPSPGGVQWRCLYIYLSYGSVRPAPSVAPAATLLSASQSVRQSVFNSRRDQSTPVVAEFGRSLAAGRYVAVANKVLIL